MTEPRSLVPFSELDARRQAQARRIYDRAFEDDERAPFDSLASWLESPSARMLPRFDILTVNDEVIGIGGYGHMPAYNFGYLAYIAVDETRRGQGHGAWLCARIFDRLREMALTAGGREPRLTFWEVRRPEDPVEAAERLHRERRIRFYERLGAQALPVDYLCPPIDKTQPPVAFHLMARTVPPGEALSRKDLIDVAMAGLVDINGAEQDSEYVRRALRSIG